MAHSLAYPQAVSLRQIGISFEEELEKAIVDAFLTSLRLTRQTAATCPIRFEADLVGDSVQSDSVEIDENDCYYMATDCPPIFMPESFEVGDLQVLTDLWTCISRLRNLDHWAIRVYKEEFFADLDKRASEDAYNELRKFLGSVPSASDPQVRKAVDSIAKGIQNEGTEWWHKYYSESFRKVFNADKDEIFSNRTRMGRALNLFCEGLVLPRLHSFLSACLVLETLFTIGKGETEHKFAVRLSRIIGAKEGLEKRKDIHRRAKRVYDERSSIVHGEKLIEAVNQDVLKDAFVFARQSLQCILLNDNLRSLYAHPGTADKPRGKAKEDAYKALSEYFLNLDLTP